MSNSPELLKPNKVTDSELQIVVGNLPTDEISTPVMVEDIEVLKQENKDLKELLSTGNSLMPGHFYAKIEELRERNRQLRLKMSSERRDSIEKISELEHQVENMLRRNQAKQARLDELEIQIEGVTDSKLHTELGNLKAENEKLRTDYAAFLESNTAVTNKLREEVQELRLQLETERSNREEIEAEREELAQLKKQVKEHALEVHREGRSIELEKDRWQGELSEARADLRAAQATIVQQKGKILELERGYTLNPNPAERRLRLEIGELQSELADFKQKSATASELPAAADLLNQLKAQRKKSRAGLADIEVILEMIEES